MQYWLFKSEPDAWSWDNQVAKGDASEPWDGIRNYQARNNMRLMALGDRGFFYHSVKEKRIVGMVEVCALSHPDPSTDDERWDCVDIRALRPFKVPVTLAQIKQREDLADMALLRQSRLSVAPVTPQEWRIICAMGETDP